jgi:hypothetical protein
MPRTSTVTESRANTMSESAAPAEFTILESLVKLEEREGSRPAIYGESAQTTKWGVVIKTTDVATRCPLRGPHEEVFEWNPLTRQRGRSLATTFSGDNVTCNVRELTAIKSGGEFPVTLSPKELGLRSFIEREPFVADLIGCEKHLPVKRFDLGLTTRPKVFGLEHDSWFTYLEQFVAGDFGLCGVLDETADFTDPEILWTMPLQAIAIQNSFSIRVTKKGAIRGSYPVDGCGYVNIITLPSIGLVKTQTFIWLSQTSLA